MHPSPTSFLWLRILFSDKVQISSVNFPVHQGNSDLSNSCNLSWFLWGDQWREFTSAGWPWWGKDMTSWESPQVLQGAVLATALRENYIDFILSEFTFYPFVLISWSLTYIQTIQNRMKLKVKVSLSCFLPTSNHMPHLIFCKYSS